MNHKKQINLDEAIKRYYQIKPLKLDLAVTVADKVFGRKKLAASTIDNWVYYIMLIVCIVILGYCISFMSQHNLSLADIFLIIPFILYFWFSITEMKKLSKRYLELD
jgi:hypothetical protein